MSQLHFHPNWAGFALVAISIFALSVQAGAQQKLAEHLRSIAVIDRPYELGDEIELAFARNQAARLRCVDNPYGLQEILIGWISGDYFNSLGDFVEVRFVSDDGNVSGGDSSFPRTKGCLRQFRYTPCLAVARYDLRGSKLAMRFRLQTGQAENRRVCEEYLKIGGMALDLRGNWKVLTGEDRMPVPKLTVGERVAGFARLWSEVKYNFAFFDQVPELDWDQVLEEYLPQVMEEQQFDEYYRLLQQCIARLQDGHTGVWPRTGPVMDRPPLLIRSVEDKAIIVDLGTSEDIEKAELKRGDEITHIDGRSVQEILEQDVYPYIFASTPQGRDLEAYGKLLEGPRDSPVNIRIRSLNGATRDLTLTRRSKWEEKPWTQLSNFEYKERSDGIIYVALRTFGSEEVVKQFDQIFQKVRKATGLIIDVRENGGGSTSNAHGIISYLTDRPLKGSHWRTRQYMPSFRAWGQEEKWHEGEHDPVQPGEESPFLGPLMVLIGPGTVSAAEDFLIPLHHSGRATLVGERTAGTTGQPLLIDLTGGRARICTKRDIYPDRREFVGIGVIPDVEVHPTREDFANGRDAILEKGLEVLRTGSASMWAPEESDK